MDLMTASPGVLYKIDGVFRNGPAKGRILPGFNLDSRKPLAENSKSTTAAIYSPKLANKVQRPRHDVIRAIVVGVSAISPVGFRSGRYTKRIRADLHDTDPSISKLCMYR